MGRGENDARRAAGLERFAPARRAQAPAIAGKSKSGCGVDRSLPRALEQARNSAVTSTQTVCNPKSSGPVWQQPVRKKPVSGRSEQPFNGSP
jgi:hypothetical protein